jgi:hypothetical protein
MNLFSKGTVLAGAAWALFACGGGSSTPSESTTPATNEPAAGGAGDMAAPAEGDATSPMTAENVKCSGINECKGKSECSGADHSCKGQNDCKGKGWVQASADDCSAKGGTVAQ